MRLYYIDESESPRCYVRTALGVDGERWNDLVRRFQDWRQEIEQSYAVPTDREMHACDLLAGLGRLASSGGADHRLSPQQWADVFTGGLRVVEEAANSIDGVEIVNVCLRKPDVKGYERVSLDRLLNRINTSVAAADGHAFLIFDEGREEMVARLNHRLRSRNPVPSKYELWEDGEAHQEHPHRERHRRPLLPKLPLRLAAPDGRPHRPRPPEEQSPRVERLGIDRAFGILNRALNRRASRRDPQGVVRR